MESFFAFICAATFLFCDVADDRVTPSPASPPVQIVDPVKPEIEIDPDPINISKKITPQTWDRAMEMRSLIREIAEAEFPINPDLWMGVMISLCHTESRCNPSAVSPVGAKGRWQWMARSAKAFMATECRDLPRNRNFKDVRDDPIWSGYCAARHLKQNMRIVTVANTDCDVINIRALRGYNEGPGNTKKAQRLAKDPGDTNSVAAASWKSRANELQTDRYPVHIMADAFNEYSISNYFQHPNPCYDYEFDRHGI